MELSHHPFGTTRLVQVVVDDRDLQPALLVSGGMGVGHPTMPARSAWSNEIAAALFQPARHEPGLEQFARWDEKERIRALRPGRHSAGSNLPKIGAAGIGRRKSGWRKLLTNIGSTCISRTSARLVLPVQSRNPTRSPDSPDASHRLQLAAGARFRFDTSAGHPGFVGRPRMP